MLPLSGPFVAAAAAPEAAGALLPRCNPLAEGAVAVGAAVGAEDKDAGGGATEVVEGALPDGAPSELLDAPGRSFGRFAADGGVFEDASNGGFTPVGRALVGGLFVGRTLLLSVAVAAAASVLATGLSDMRVGWFYFF